METHPGGRAKHEDHLHGPYANALILVQFFDHLRVAHLFEQRVA